MAAARQSSAATDPRTESQCIQVLQSDASLGEKDAVCARLKLVGTSQCIPALAALLTDEQLSHSARYVLEAMSSPEAGHALAEALGKTTGLTRVGIIESLGFRGEREAVPALAKLLEDSDVEVGAAAAAALGQIPGPEALSALEAISSNASEPLRRAVVDATLRSAQRLLASGDRAKAQAVFQRVFDSQREDFVRLAAYRGLILASGKEGLALATQAIAGKAGPSQTAALQLVHDLDAPGATEAFAQLLPQVGPAAQVALLEGLSQRDDPSAAPAVAQMVSNIVPEVRLAAISALGELGDATAIPILAKSAASATVAEQTAARDALVQLRRGKVTERFLSQFATAEPAVQAELARALGARGDESAVPALLDLARKGSAPARKGALLALGQLVDQAQLASLVQLVVEARSDTREQAAEALNSACQHIRSRRGQVAVDPLVGGLASASAEARVTLLPICAGFNDPQVRSALRAAIADKDPQVHAAAIRALCQTTDAELLPDLLKLACAAPEQNLRTLAIRGCVRLTTQEESVKLPNSQRVEALKSILAAGPSVEQKRVVLAGLAEVPDLEALKLAESMLTEAAIEGEAARAIIKIAPRLKDATIANAALKQVVSTAQDAAAVQAAQAALRGSTSTSGYITSWQVAGPYRQAGKNYIALFDIAFPPETFEPQGTQWQTLGCSAGAQGAAVMDLGKALGGQQCAAYGRARIHCDQETSARLKLGSDDGVKVWLNQKLVHAHKVARSVRPGSDTVNVTLQSGWNDLLFKVTQNNQGWGFCAQLLNPDGSPLEGLQFDPDPRSVQTAAASPIRRPTVSPTAFAAGTNCDRSFRKIQLTGEFWAEGATFGDFNRDGQMDIVSGPYWYEGPDFKKRHELWPANASFKRKKSDGTEETVPGFEGALGSKNAYSECFFSFTYDFNADGWPDVLVIGFPGKAAAWFENPAGADRPWARHEVFDEVGNESPGFADVTGDGKPEVICCARNSLGYAEAEWKNPAAPWTFHPITPNTPKGAYQKFMHGLGIGDINGDGRTDIIEKSGWWEQPAVLAGDPVWVKHPYHFADAGAQMLVYDVNGDGLNDVITCLNAHGYGLAWYEQVRTNGAISFLPHIILNPDAVPDHYGFSFTQLHALALADVDGDGLMDIVTGKRFWAHGKNGHDPESDGFPAVLCWFQLKRSGLGKAEFIPHLIDNDSGVGTQVTVGFISSRAHPDIIVGNKKGLFVFEHQGKPGG